MSAGAVLTTLVPTVFHADVAARRPDLLHPNLDRPTMREWGAREVALLDETTVCVVLREWPTP